MKQDMQVLTSHASVEWNTPKEYTDLAHAVMGGIDLDPASNSLAQTWINARTYYTEADNGLSLQWHGRVWLNPPYGKNASGKSLQAIWSKYLEEQYLLGNVREAIMLINSTHGYSWYEYLWNNYPVCCARERITFLRTDGAPAGKAKRGQTFVYFGRAPECFSVIFKEVGRVLLP